MDIYLFKKNFLASINFNILEKKIMKKFLLFGLMTCFQTFFSQVSMEKNKLVKDGVKYKFSKYEDVFKNAEAQNYFKKARTNKTVSEVFAYTGGFGLGFGIGRLISGGEKTVYVNGSPQTTNLKSAGWSYIIIGSGLIGIGIPFAIAAGKNAKKALNTENG
jgi:hypothetical protein